MKKIVRLNESELKNIIKENVRNLLNETEFYSPIDYDNGNEENRYFLCSYGGGNRPIFYIWRTKPSGVGFSDAAKLKISPVFYSEEEAMQWGENELNKSKKEVEKWSKSFGGVW